MLYIFKKLKKFGCVLYYDINCFSGITFNLLFFLILTRRIF